LDFGTVGLKPKLRANPTFDTVSITPFAEASNWTLALTLIAYFLGFLVRGAFGFGSNLPIVILTAWALGPHHAVILVVLTGMMAQIYLFPQGVRNADWPLALKLASGVYLGIAIGTFAFVSLEPKVFAPVLGALVILLVAMDRLNVINRLSKVVDLRSRLVTFALSVMGGFVGTVSGGGGIYFLAPFLRYMCPTPIGFRSTNLVISGIFLAGRTIFIAVAGLIDLTSTVEAIVLMPFAFLGGWAGGRWFARANSERFFRLLSALLVLGALLLILRNFL